MRCCRYRLRVCGIITSKLPLSAAARVLCTRCCANAQHFENIVSCKTAAMCGFVVAAVRRHGVICPVSECEPQVKHELSGIDAMFLSVHERYAKCELRNMV